MNKIDRKKTAGTCLSPSHNPDFLNKVDEVIEDITDRTEFYNPLEQVIVDELWNYTEAELAQRYIWFPGYISFSEGDVVYSGDNTTWSGFFSERWIALKRGIKIRQPFITPDESNTDVLVFVDLYGYVGGVFEDSLEVIWDGRVGSDWAISFWTGGVWKFYHPTGIPYSEDHKSEIEIDVDSEGFFTIIINGETVDFTDCGIPEEERFLNPECICEYGFIVPTYTGTRQVKFGPLSFVSGKQIVD